VAPREIEFDGDGNWTDLPIPHGEIVER
jgi:hypothetical protein